MILEFLTGAVEIAVCGDLSKCMQLLSEAEIQISKIRNTDNCLTFTAPLYNLPKIKNLFKEIEYSIVSVNGLPKLLYKYRKRWGMFIGIAIVFALIFVSGKYIWSLNISGNENVSDKAILETLDELGCHPGTKIKDIDFDILCNDFLIKCPDIAWISVNMDGTHANVEVKETLRGNAGDEGINNIIASSDGQILQITAFGGRKQVAIGDVVHKGELLISAVSTFGEGRTSYESADGLVLAEVTQSFTIEIPMESEEKIKTGSKTNENVLKFFDFYINLSLNSSIPYEKYDKIEENRQIVLFDVVELPIWLVAESFEEYRLDKVTVTENEARRLALVEYRSKLRDIAKNSDILSLSTAHKCDGEKYTVECTVYCITDIAESSPITIEN